MIAKYYRLYPENPEMRKVEKVVEVLKNGGVIIYPTDTVYALGCDMMNQRAIEKLCHIKGIKSGKQTFSFIFSSISEISTYTRHIDTTVYKLMKKVFPGPFTFILEASSALPKILKVKKKTVGVRIPDNGIPLAIVERLGNPIMTTSIKDTDELVEYITDPGLIREEFEKKVDVIIDGGMGKNTGSTILDCSTGEIEIIRKGLGEINF